MKETSRQTQSDGDNTHQSRQLSALTPLNRTPAARNGAGTVANAVPAILRSVPIPSNNRTVRRKVVEAYWRDEQDSHTLGIRRLTVEALPLVVGLFDNVQRRRKLAKALDAQERRHGVLTTEGAARQPLDKVVALDQIILRQLDALGWTPTALARLGVDLVRLRSATKDSGEAAPQEDIEALEQRIVQRLKADG